MSCSGLKILTSTSKLSRSDEIDETAPVVREGLKIGISGQWMTRVKNERMLGLLIFLFLVFSYFNMSIMQSSP